MRTAVSYLYLLDFISMYHFSTINHISILVDLLVVFELSFDILKVIHTMLGIFVAWDNVTQQRAQCIVCNAIRNKVTIKFLPLNINVLLISLLSLLSFQNQKNFTQKRNISIVNEKSVFVDLIEIKEMLYCN